MRAFSVEVGMSFGRFPYAPTPRWGVRGYSEFGDGPILTSGLPTIRTEWSRALDQHLYLAVRLGYFVPRIV